VENVRLGIVVSEFNYDISPNLRFVFQGVTDARRAGKGYGAIPWRLGLLEPVKVERVLGRAEVRQIFKISRLGLIAGSLVIEGSITRNAEIRVIRDEQVIHQGKISSLKRFQDDVREVAKDFECGIGITGLSDLREGDIIEAFVVEEHARVV